MENDRFGDLAKRFAIRRSRRVALARIAQAAAVAIAGFGLGTSRAEAQFLTCSADG